MNAAFVFAYEMAPEIKKMINTNFNQHDDEDLLASVFEERAENLSKKELYDWTRDTPRASEILAKLKGPGAKLLSGPRGCGKSTFLRKAYYELLESGDVLPAYINYAKSLALEPLFYHRANALQIFRQWVLSKVIVGVAAAFKELGKPLPDELDAQRKQASRLIHSLETGAFDKLEEDLLSPTQILALLEHWTKSNGFRRCVLLMDDAAHAFSPDQQREFFEIFRVIRSRVVAAKAAVYPGITSYSAHFHVGHEAELLEAWNNPDDENYLTTMKDMIRRRLPPNLYDELSHKNDLVGYLALASFGLPRGFLNMVQQLLSVEEDEITAKPNRSLAEAAVKNHAESVRGIFQALKSKLPRFKHFITVGLDVERAIQNSLKTFNGNRNDKTRAVVVAISEPVEKELDRILSLMEYAGLVRRLDKVSRGVKGVFQRYILHYAILLSENILNLGQSYTIDTAIDALEKRDAHAFVRVRSVALLGDDYQQKCKIELPPCQKCKSPRTSEDQRFCMKCGAQLAETSVYTELIRSRIDKLPLTQRKISDLKEYTSIKTVQDILLDEDMQQIKSVPHIGPVWASKIRNAAEEFVSV